MKGFLARREAFRFSNTGKNLYFGFYTYDHECHEQDWWEEVLFHLLYGVQLLESEFR